MIEQINVEQLKVIQHASTDIHLLDVRRDDEVVHGMIDGAVHIPLDQLEARYSELDPSHEWIVYCRLGGRSQSACEFLASKDYAAKNLEGGIMAFEADREDQA